MNPIAVLGAGSWGTALALQFAQRGRPVRLWGRDRTAVFATVTALLAVLLCFGSLTPLYSAYQTLPPPDEPSSSRSDGTFISIDRRSR